MRIFTALLLCAALHAAEIPSGLKKDLLFRASFEKPSAEAETARGDARIYSAPNYKEQSAAVPGFGAAPVEFAPGAGLGGGGALRFTKKNTNALFYKGEANAGFTPGKWTGTVSFWLKLNPETELEPGFCDPIQITDKAYNDSAIWVDFTKDEKPRHFRLGVFGDLKTWNPKNLPADKDPTFNNRLIVETRHPFRNDRWTHVLVTWKGLGSPGGEASLYLDGKWIGTRQGINEIFVWDMKNAAIRVGVNYVGLFDELMLFNRALSASEAAGLHRALSR